MKEQYPKPMVLWAGIDVAKASVVAAVWGHEELKEMQARPFARTRKEALALLAWLREGAPTGARLGVVMETTATFSEQLATFVATFLGYFLLQPPFQPLGHDPKAPLRSSANSSQAKPPK